MRTCTSTLLLLAASACASHSASAAPEVEAGVIGDLFNKAKELGDLSFATGTQVFNATLGGAFVVAWEDKKPNFLGLGGGSRLAIYSADRSKQLWASSFGKAFVGVGITPQDLKEYYYGFKVSQPGFSKQSTTQTVATITPSADGSVVIVSGALTYQANNTYTAQVPYSLRLSTAASHKQLLSVEVSVDPAVASSLGVNRLVLEYSSEKSEQFYGFGQQFPRAFSLKGKRVPIIVNEQGLGRGLEPITLLGNTFSNNSGGDEFSTYAPMPHYQSSKLHSFFLENTEYSVFDLTKDDTTRIELASTTLKGQLINGQTPLDLVEAFTDFNGRQRKLPDWVSTGAIVGMQGGRAFVEQAYAKLKAAGAPVAAFWLQDWVGNRAAPWGTALWWNWEVDEARYPNWTQFVSNLRDENVRVMTYVNPHAGDIKGLKTDPAPKRYLYEELVANGFDVKNKDGNTQLKYQNAAMFDLTNPKARAWVKSLIKENVLLGGKVSGYMCDFGEALELDAKLSNGEDAAAYHNKYPVEWAKINAEAVRELGMEDEVVYFMRSGFTRAPQYTPLYWLGDQLQTWDEYDGLKSVVFASTIGGLSGISLTHPDIGGYNYFDLRDRNIPLPLKYQRTKELFLRSAEFAAFTAAFRTHDGSNVEKAWQFYSDDETLTLFARYAKIYVAWGFYREQLLDEVVTKGYPLIRHLYLHYSDDAKARELKYQFLVGTELLVAPVVDEKKADVTVYLPQGKWVHVWTNTVYDGLQSVKVASPIGQPAVFYPQGSRVGAQFVANLQAAGILIQ